MSIATKIFAALTGLDLIAVFAGFLGAIWLGDLRWASSAFVALFALIPLFGATAISGARDNS